MDNLILFNYYYENSEKVLNIELKWKLFVVKAPKEYSVELIDIPEPVDNEILVKLETSGICHIGIYT
nr:hypothetical protein [Mycoplasmopsis bovis]